MAALPIKNFRGKLKGKTPYTYTKQLNYSLNTYQERNELLNEILKEDDFYVEYFDDFHKVNVNKEDYLSIDRNVCNSLEKMANYLLHTKEAKNDGEWKIAYNFYTDETLDKKNEKDYNRRTETIMFLVDKNKNYRKQALQEIFESDYEDQDFNTEIKCYHIDKPDEYIVEQTNYMKKFNDFINHSKYEIDNYKDLKYKQKKDIQNTMKDIKTSSIYIKDKIKGTIYYNHCLPESEDINWFLINFTSQEQMLALLKVSPRNLLSDLGMIINDLNKLLEQAEISDFEKDVIELWRRNDYTQEKIAEELDVSQPFISNTLKSICNKVIQQYKENYEDWFYLNYRKGKYKTCSICQGVKLTSKFGKHSQTKDGFYPSCKKCRQN